MKKRSFAGHLWLSILAHTLGYIIIEFLLVECCSLLHIYYDGTLYNVNLPNVHIIEFLYPILLFFSPWLYLFIFFIGPIVASFALVNGLWSRFVMCVSGTNETEIPQIVKKSKKYYYIWVLYILVFHALLALIAYIAISGINTEIDGSNIGIICKTVKIVVIVVHSYAVLRNIYPSSPEELLRGSVCKYCHCIADVKIEMTQIQHAEYEEMGGGYYYTTEKVGEVRTGSGETIGDVYGEVAHDSGGKIKQVAPDIYEHKIKCCVCGRTEIVRTTNRKRLTKKEKQQLYQCNTKK